MASTTLKSVGAIAAGIIAVFALSIGTDILLAKTNYMKVEPFDANPWWLIVIVILYRSIYNVIGGWIVARLAPNRPMRHAIIIGLIGVGISIIGTIVMWNIPPHWYPIALIILAFPSAWAGGKLYQPLKTR